MIIPHGTNKIYQLPEQDDKVILLREMARAIEKGEIKVEDLLLVYTIENADGSPDISMATVETTTKQQAYWMMGRLQTRMTLVENANS